MSVTVILVVIAIIIGRTGLVFMIFNLNWTELVSSCVSWTIKKNIIKNNLSGIFSPDAKPYACGQCGSKTTHISSLTNHYKQFHPNFTAEIKENYSVAPRQQCRQCRKVFTFGKDNLKRHLSRCKGALKNKQGELVLHDSVDLYCSNLRDHCLFGKYILT